MKAEQESHGRGRAKIKSVGKEMNGQGKEL